jgi:hypothetical protein
LAGEGESDLTSGIIVKAVAIAIITAWFGIAAAQTPQSVRLMPIAGFSSGGSGPAGPEGPPGPPGPEGPQGPPGTDTSTLPVVVPPGVDVTGTPAVGQTTFYTPPVTALYKVDLYLVIDTIGSAGGMTAAVFWTDSTDSVRTLSTPQIDLASPSYAQMSFVIQAKGGSPLQYSATICCNATGARVWHLYVVLEKLT